MNIREGEAVFMKPGNSLWNMRRQSARAALLKRETRRFVVTREEMYYTNMLERMLNDARALQREAMELGDDIIGDINGGARCAYLWESGREGLLLHREGESLLCAFAPVVTYEIALRERELAKTLARLADTYRDTPIYLDVGLKAGKRSMGDVLRYLCDTMEI